MKYDDSYKKKEEVLRKVFFKECAKEEEKRINTTNANGGQVPNSNGAAPGSKTGNQGKNQPYDPI